MADRRSATRLARCTPVSISVSPEQPLCDSVTINVSTSGMLIAFEEPVALAQDQRAVATMTLSDGRMHALLRVRRIARGDDFRTYVAFSFEDLRDEERHRLTEFVDSVAVDERE